jgi:sugar/nucleoside kinase (ribokinase family)
MRNDVVCVGLTILDILGRPIDALPEGGKSQLIEQIRLTPAGTAAGPVVIAAKLGMQATLVGAVGKDGVGDFLISALQQENVVTEYMQRRSEFPTSATMLAVNSQGHRPNFHAVGASVFLELDDRQLERIQSSTYIHWGGVGTMLNLDGAPSAEILKTAKSKGATITCDFIAPMEGTRDALVAVMPYVDYFMPSLEEAMEVAETTTMEDTAAFFLNHGARTCILKCGAQGSVIVTGESITPIPAFQIDVVDTTGCGDAYCAGFIAGLANGRNVEKSCRFASATAALVATGLGSDAGVTDFASVQNAMENLPQLEISASFT